MSRTARYKIGYVVAIGVIATLAFLLMSAVDADPLVAALLVALFLFIPGRVQGILYRELFRGRRLLAQHREVEAIGHFHRYLADVRARPWLKRMIWLSWSIYTPDVEAMALNNIGAAHLRLGHLDEAESALRRALALDEKYPLPHFNMAVLHEMRGNRTLAEKALAEAVALGYSGGTVDTIINHAHVLLARAEGRGVKDA